MPESPISELAGVNFAETVRCLDCGHWHPSGVAQHGDCAVRASGTADLWASSPRACGAYLPLEVAESIRAMAERWQYTADDLDWALDQAAQEPEGWRELIAADLAGRRWPGSESAVR